MEEKNRLDQFFKAQLSDRDAGASPGGWDVPSDRVWEGIEATISDRRKPAFWWRTLLLLLLAIMALVFASLWFASQQQVKQLERTVAEQRQQIEALIDANSLENTPQNERSPLTDENGSTKGESLEAAGDAPGTEPAELITATSAAATGNEPPIDRNVGKKQPNSTGANEPTATVVEEPKEDTPETQARTPELQPEEKRATPAPVPARWAFLEGNNPDLTPRFDLAHVDGLQQNASTRFLPLEFSFAPVRSDRLLTYKGKDIDTRFERTETSGFSWTASVLTGVQFNERLRLLTGIDYFSYSQESTHLMAMRYTLQNSVIDMDGNRINTYTTDVPTSFGDAGVEIRVAEDGGTSNPDLSEGRLFPVEISAATNIRQLGIPMLLEYQSGGSVVQWISRAGLIGNWITDGDFTLQRARVLHPGMQAQTFRITSDKLTRKLNDFTLDLQLSTGAKMNLTDRFRLTLLPTFRTNLTPIFNNQKLKTNIYSWSVNVGLAFQL